MSSSSAQQLADVLVGRAFAQSQTSHSFLEKAFAFSSCVVISRKPIQRTTISQHRHQMEGRPTKIGVAAQRRQSPVAGACFPLSHCESFWWDERSAIVNSCLQ